MNDVTDTAWKAISVLAQIVFLLFVLIGVWFVASILTTMWNGALRAIGLPT